MNEKKIIKGQGRGHEAMLPNLSINLKISLKRTSYLQRYAIRREQNLIIHSNIYELH